MSMLILTAAALIAGQSAPIGGQRSASDLTRDLNTLPASAAAASPATNPAQTSARTPPPIGGGAPLTPGGQTNPGPTTPAGTPAPARSLPPIGGSAPLTPAQRTGAPATATPPASEPAPTTPPAPRPRPAETTRPATAAASPALDASTRARLPFSIDLPDGVDLVVSHEGSDAAVYAVRQGPRTLAMIYAGPSSQFPIYDGQMVQAGGRASIIVPEGARRVAMEHLFQRAAAPREVHVWVASVDGADRDLAERIAQSVDIR